MIINKLKHILEIILNFLKSLIASLFNFFFDLFKNGQDNNKELKSQKLDNIKDNKKNISNDAGIEDPSILSKIPDSIFIVTSIELEKLISNIFCEELELKENDLTKKELDYIKLLNEEIFPLIQENINNKSINNKDVLESKVKIIVIDKLENQYKLENSKSLQPEKIIITPLIMKKSKENNNSLNNKDTFISNKILKNKENNERNIFPNAPLNNIVNDFEKSNIPSEKLESEKVEYIDTLFNEDLNINDNSKTYNDFSNSDTIPKTKDIINDIPNISNDTIIKENSNNNDESNEFKDQLEKPNDLPTNKVNDNSFTKEDIKQENSLKEENKAVEEKILTQPEIYENYDYEKIDNLILNISYQCKEEIKKEEFEDKNYEELEKRINYLLEEINKLKLKKLSNEYKNKLAREENKLMQLKSDLLFQKQKDITLERNMLNEIILNEDLVALEENLQNLHMEDKHDLQNLNLNNLEELNYMPFDKAKKLEKELLKLKLKKALNSLEMPFLLSLPFLRNKYFRYFTSGLLVNRHLKLFDAVLKRKEIEFEPVEISHIKTGINAFNDSLETSKQNIEYLNYLEEEAFRKYPELRLDVSYLLPLNSLKTKLLKQQERLIKKEEKLEKYNLKLNRKIRKLQKKKNQNI